MKKIRKTLSLILSVLMITGIFFALPFSASAAETGKSFTGIATICNDNTKTVFSLNNGKTETVKNAVKAESLENNPIVADVKSYEVVYKDKSVCNVELRSFGTGSSAMLKGYYAITFTIPDTQKEVFLTGLSAVNVDVVEKKLIAGYSGNKDFVMEELDFIDAEKEMKDKDTLLCWAGTNANMLRYTGWAGQAGFETEDEVLECFSQNFTDNGYQVSAGLHWFFDGQASDNVKYEDSGRFFPDYLPDDIIKDCDVHENFAEKAPRMISDLKAGKGIGLTIEWLDEDGSIADMAHAITLFGVVTDNSFDESDLNHYDSFIIADSDNSTEYDRSKRDSGPDRRLAPNTLTSIKLVPYINEESGYCTVVGKNYGGVLYLYTTLEPYSDDLSALRETDPDATLNRNKSYDFGVDEVYLSNTGGGAKSKKVCNRDVYVSFNANDKSGFSSSEAGSFKGNLKIDLTVSNAGGEVVFTDSFTKNYDLYKGDIHGDFEAGNLETGKYTARITLNSDRAVSEAFYLNNSKTVEFEVVDKAYDLSGVKLSIDSDKVDFGEGFTTDVNFVYDGFDTCALCESFDEAGVYYSFLDDDGWSLWEKIREYEDDAGEAAGRAKSTAAGVNESKESALPKKAMIPASGTKVKFRLEFVKDSVAYSVVSSEYPLLRRSFEIERTDNNTETTSVIPKGANKLNDGEQFAFTINNTSIGDAQAIEGTFELYASGLDCDNIKLAGPVSFRLEKGEKSEEYKFSSWDESINLNQTCIIFVRVTADGFNEKGGLVSRLKIQEDKSTVITTSDDIDDAGDGLISFREAVAYAAETGGDVTVGEYVGDSLYLNSTVDINGSVKFDGHIDSNENKPDRIYIIPQNDEDGSVKNIRLLNIGSGAQVEIKNTEMIFGNAEKGAAVYADGGDLRLYNCYIKNCEAKQKGGAVYLNGGKMIAENSDFSYNNAPYGTDIFIDGNAQVEMLNCNLVPEVETAGIIYNYNGSLNLINSTIMPIGIDNYDNYGNGKLFNRAIISNRNTNVVNSIVFTKNSKAISGDVNVYSSVTNGMDAEVTADQSTITREIEEICRIDEDGAPFLCYIDRDHFAPYLTGEANFGSFTSLKDGRIVLTDSQGNVCETGVKTSFTADELSLDYAGNARTTFFGAFSDILPYGALLDDENTIISGVDNMVYTGSPITQKFEVYYCGDLLDYGVDYNVSYQDNINAGVATITVTGINDYRGEVTHSFVISKAPNTMTVSTATKTVKYAKVKKAAQTVKNAITVKKNQGAVTYKKISGSAKLKISNKGVITVKKGTKKGTYKIKVKVTAKGNSNYSAKSLTKTVTIKVK